MICYRFDNSSCQYLDLNNELSEWKEVSIPIKNGVSSLLGMIDQRYLFLIGTGFGNMEYEIYDTENLNSAWEKFEVKDCRFNTVGKGILYIDDSSLLLLGNKSRDDKLKHKIEISINGRKVSSVQIFHNCIEKNLNFPSCPFFQCGNELVN